MTGQQASNRLLTWVSRNSAPVALAVIFAFGTLVFPKFLTPLNLNAIAYQYSIIGFLALGQLLVILTEGIDLSQGSMVAFTSIVIATLMKTTSPPIAVAGGVAAATLLGAINGLLVSRTRIPAFIVTLGMLGVARGLALLISDANPIAIEVAAFSQVGRGKLLGIPGSFLFWIVVSLVMLYLLTQRRLGRHIYAVGSNAEGARLSGVNVTQIKLWVYTLSAFLASVGAVVWTSRLRSGSPIGAVNYEFESIAAVIVGGGSLFGGVGTVVGTFAGVLIFGVINSCLNLAGISPYWQGTLKGILILLAVALSQIRRTGPSGS
jgi:ribose transport system permease protein